MLDYLLLTQKKQLFSLSRPKKLKDHEFLEMDAFTQQNLEILTTLSKSKEGSLLHAIDRTLSPMGSRLFLMRLLYPVKNPQKINERLDGIEFFVKHSELCETSREFLKQTTDSERAISRLMIGRGGPRDLLALNATLKLLPFLRALLEKFIPFPKEVQKIFKHLESYPKITLRLDRVLKEDLPFTIETADLLKKVIMQFSIIYLI